MRFAPIRISLVISLLLLFLQLMTRRIRDLYLGLNITLTPDTFTPVRSIGIASFEIFEYVGTYLGKSSSDNTMRFVQADG